MKQCAIVIDTLCFCSRLFICHISNFLDSLRFSTYVCAPSARMQKLFMKKNSNSLDPLRFSVYGCAPSHAHIVYKNEMLSISCNNMILLGPLRSIDFQRSVLICRSREVLADCDFSFVLIKWNRVHLVLRLKNANEMS